MRLLLLEDAASEEVVPSASENPNAERNQRNLNAENPAVKRNAENPAVKRNAENPNEDVRYFSLKIYMWKYFAFLNAIFYAAASLALRKYEIVDRKITSFQIFFSIITIGFFFTLFIAISFKKYRDQIIQLYNSLIVNKTKPKFAFWIILVSVLYILGDISFFTSHITTPHITLLLLIGTLVGASIEITGSYLFFNEKLKTRSIIGIMVMLSGAYLL